MGFCVGSLFYKVVLGDLSSFAIILLKKRELWLLYYNSVLAVVFLSVFCVSSSWCHGLYVYDCVIPDRTHLFFYKKDNCRN